MGKTAQLDARSMEWARRMFQRYYEEQVVDPPSRFPRREFAAFPFSEQTLMRRHASFTVAEEFREYLAHEAPRHVYYSSAYYKFPDHPTMASKEWLGADLIFDLDADHLRGAGSIGYTGQLALVKDRVRDLVDDFLVGDFGIDRASMQLVFSGGRGYHVHVFDPAYWPLSSPERRELVEYIQGAGFDSAEVVTQVREEDRSAAIETSDGDQARRRGGRHQGFHRLPSPDAPGWNGRTTRALVRLLERWDRIGKEAAGEEIERLGIPQAEARRLARSLVAEGRGLRIREGLTLDVFPRGIPHGFLELVLRQAAVEVQGETDAPVTTDIHRLIRLPRSLHGGSGLRVVPMTREELDAFEPLRDARLPAPEGEERTVELLETVEYPFPGGPMAGSAGERRTLPTPAALFLVLRGEARLPPLPG